MALLLAVCFEKVYACIDKWLDKKKTPGETMWNHLKEGN